MPVLTLAQLASHVTRLANMPAMPLSLASEYVNLAYAHVAQTSGIQHQAREAVAFASTVTSDNRLGVPSDYDYTLGLRLGVPNSWSTATSRTTTWTPLTKQAPPWGEPYQSDTSGQPEMYAEYATWLELRPSPSSVYSVEMRYARKITEMTTSATTPILDEQWHWAIALRGAALAASDDTMIETRNYARYNAYVRDVRTDQARRRMDPRGQNAVYLRRVR